MSVTNTTTPLRTLGEMWPKLEPAMLNPTPHTKHIKLAPSTSYAAGQLVGLIATGNPNAGRYAKPGVTGVPADGPHFPLMYPWTTNASGDATIGDTFDADKSVEASVEAYYAGAFYVRDLKGAGSAALASAAALAAVGGLVQGEAYNSANAIVVLGRAAPPAA